MRISDWSSDVCSSDLLGWRTVANIAGVDAPPPLAGSDSFQDNNSGRVGNVLNAPDRKASLWQFSGMHKTTVSRRMRSEEHTSELQSLMRITYAVFCLKHTKIVYKIS